VRATPQPLPEDFTKEAARLPAPSRKPARTEGDARKPRRDGPRHDRQGDQGGEGKKAHPFRRRRKQGVGAHRQKVRKVV
jgi:ATP-dependent RNA helicase RhlE